MIDFKEQTLRQALKDTACRELPKRYDESSGEIWIKAIVLVKKRNCTVSYALAARRGDGLISYVRDYGQMSPICGLISIHPYMYLDKERFLNFNTKSGKYGILASAFGKDTALSILDMPEPEQYARLVDAGIKMQELNNESDIYNNAISEMYKGGQEQNERPDSDNTETMKTETGVEVFKTIASAKNSEEKTSIRRKTTRTRK